MTTQARRLSLSISKDIVNDIDEIANARKLSRSKLISMCLEEMLEKEKEELLIEGYKAMAKEHSKFAAFSSRAAKEVLPSW
jgi:metal-responsive CopG/Arc/MetJ family transcriptional regulator